jgi:photosystem II stability/assembly factor-like uncharacterized protein
MKNFAFSLCVLLMCMIVNAQKPEFSQLWATANNSSQSISSELLRKVLKSGFPVIPLSMEEQNHKNIRNSWEKIGPGGGGATFIPTFSYKTPDNFLIRCDMTGTYLTNDGGSSYQQINFAGGASCFAFDPRDANIIYIGSSALNRSKDGGKTWEQIFPVKEEVKREVYLGDHADFSIEANDNSLYINGGRIGTVRVDPAQFGALYFSMGSFFFYSFDSGRNWKRENTHQNIEFIYTNKSELKNEVIIFSARSICIFNKSLNTFSVRDIPKDMQPAFSFTGGTRSKSNKPVFYALHHNSGTTAAGDEVWISEDKGNTWKLSMDPVVTNAATGRKPGYSMLTCSEFGAEKAYLVSSTYEERRDSKILRWYGALKTTNAGNSWEWVWKGGGDGKGVANLKDAWAEKAFGNGYIRLIDVGVSPTDGNVAIVTDWYRSMKTTDGGKNWREIYSIEQSDGTYTSRGLDVTTSYGVHFDPFNKNHIAISYTDIGFHHSFNNGKSWIRSVEGVPERWINTCYWVVFDPDVKGKLWSSWSSMHDFPRGKMTRTSPRWKETGQGGVCVSTDDGKTWKPSNEGMGMNSPSTSIVLDPRSAPGDRTLYATAYNKGVFKSTDDGKTWSLKNNGIDGNTCAFELTLTDNGNLYLTVSATAMYKDGKKGRNLYSGAVYKSKDGAESWTKLNIANGFLFPNGIDFDRQNPDRIWLACWADIKLGELLGGDVVQATGGDERINMPGGIFMSEDGGTTWTSVFDKEKYVYDITVDTFHPGRLYCNTFNKSAFRSDDYGKTWKKITGYDFHWGHRVIVDKNDPEKIFITTFGSSVWHGIPETE